MKKLGEKGKVHPSSPSPVPSITDHLTSLLPATILTLAAALSPEDNEVLAYLVSCSGSVATAAENFSVYNKATHKISEGQDHAPVFECNCFRCYMSFWARWDTSPNRQLIHEVIEAYEEGLCNEKRRLKKKKKKKRRNYSRKSVSDELKDQCYKDQLGSPETMSCGAGGGDAEDVVDIGGGDEVEFEKGSMRKIVSFLGEKIIGFLHRN